MRFLSYTVIFLLIFLFTVCERSFAQLNVGSLLPCDPSAMLQVNSPNKGVLFPNVALTGSTFPAPLFSFVAGMVVYNTAAAGSGNAAVSPGFYYSDGAQWLQLQSTTNQPWYNAATQTAAQSNTQNIYQMGLVGINTMSPSTNLEVNGGAGSHYYSVFQHTNNIVGNARANIPYYGLGFDSSTYQTTLGGYGGIRFYSNAASYANPDMLMNNGNLGIGTTNPTNTLHVVGSVRITGLPTGTAASDSLVTTNGTGVINKITLAALEEQIDIYNGRVNVAAQCAGKGTVSSPWVSADGSAGIRPSLAKLNTVRRILFFPPGIYATNGSQTIDFSQSLPNLSDPTTYQSFVAEGVFFEGHGAQIWVNNRQPLRGGNVGLCFRWPNQAVFYWKWTGFAFLGDVDASMLQFGTSDADFPLNSCEMDLAVNNGYIPSNYATAASPSRGITIYRPLETRIHVVGVSATGYGVELSQAVFCTISGAFSNTNLPNSHSQIYPFSYGLRLNNSSSNTFTHMDLEVAYNGIKFDNSSVLNTFTTILVTNCSSTGYVFDNSGQTAAGKNLVVSILNNYTYEGNSKVQGLYAPGSNSSNMIIQNINPGLVNFP